MNLDTFESVNLEVKSLDLEDKLSKLRGGFESSIESKHDAYLDASKSIDEKVGVWIGRDVSGGSLDSDALKMSVLDAIKTMYEGADDIGDGKKGLGLKQIGEMKINPEFSYQNIKQHSGFAAEVIGTAKENTRAIFDNSGIKTYRADDRPDLYKRNDEYVDKIRVDKNGNVLERIQVKFVGKNANECLDKLASNPFAKYFEDGKVDKVEVPKDYYDGIKEMIPDRISKLEKQLEHVRSDGKEDVAKSIESRIDRLNKIDKMIEQSTVGSDEARYATLHPKRYSAKILMENSILEGNKAGVESAVIAGTITAAVSTVDNIPRVLEGEITPKEAFTDIGRDTAYSMGLAYGEVFISSGVSSVMSASSHELIRSLNKSHVPAAMISFGVESYDSITDYAQGVIDGEELAGDLTENAVQIAGSVAGMAAADAIIGSVVPGAGTAVGFTAGLVSGIVGCAVASEAYSTAVKLGADNADVLAEKAQEMASRTVEIARDAVPDHVDSIISSLNHFATTNSLPFSV